MRSPTPIHTDNRRSRKARGGRRDEQTPCQYIATFVFSSYNRFRVYRPNKGLLFRCECCNHELHSDLVGARNIAMRTLLVRQDWTSTGTLSMCPDVSGEEAKAEVLQRFSELRWSLDTNPYHQSERASVSN